MQTEISLMQSSCLFHKCPLCLTLSSLPQLLFPIKLSNVAIANSRLVQTRLCMISSSHCLPFCNYRWNLQKMKNVSILNSPTYWGKPLYWNRLDFLKVILISDFFWKWGLGCGDKVIVQWRIMTIYHDPEGAFILVLCTCVYEGGEVSLSMSMCSNCVCICEDVETYSEILF